MQERYSEEIKVFEGSTGCNELSAELSCAHILVALSSEGFSDFYYNVKADERNFAQEAKALMRPHSFCKGQDRQLVMSTALARVLGLAAGRRSR